MKKNETEKKPVKKLVGYLAAPIPYLPNNDNYMHLNPKQKANTPTIADTNK